MAINDSKPKHDKIEEEAAGWVARLQSSDATDQDRSDFRAWLTKDPAHLIAYEEFKGLWADLEHLPIARRRLHKLRPARGAVIANIAGLCLIAGLAAMFVHLGLVDRLRADFYTTVGEVRNVTLEDGTLVSLNTDSAIAVRFAGPERRVELLRGEAFFDVAKNPDRPFVVADDTMTAIAIGTRFAFRSSGVHGDVQVEEGAVEVRSGAEHTVLKAGDMASLSEEGALSVRRIDVANAVAWKDNKLVFSGAPLRDVLATLERYRYGSLLVLGEQAAMLRVSGVFDLDDTDKALRSLEQSLPVRLNYLTGMIVVVRSR
ncbi:FecR family protein [Aminobacter sp. AP02]|uniref:FecR family protein n=1 Tax=Aminobacter sp. AP02 TaxID=2135737 RepID=UPI000D6BBF91|nr:FecR family protein [Aminobacter sp. AP02]PWK69820.1 FecR family protein [Aminobacter sp. AP02]